MPRLLKLALTQFRNYERLTWQPDNALLVLTGTNGSGKTNLLEAISLLSPGRGLRAAPLAQLGRNGSEAWGVSASFEIDGSPVEIGTGAQAGADGSRRSFLFNGRQSRSAAGWEEAPSAVWITPQMDRLFSEGASGRRRFLDRLVIAVTPQHARELAAYDRAMSQRNRLLQTRFGEQSWLGALEATMAQHAVAVAAARNDVVHLLSHYASTALGAFPAIQLRMDCPISDRLLQHPALAVEDWLRTRLESLRDQDRTRGRTTSGVHRSDFVLSDHQSGQQAALASTGQQKALLLGVILAHARLVEDRRNAAPLLLLDEPLVHLDAGRRATLLESVRSFRTTVILTGTDVEPFAELKSHARFSVLHQGAFLPS
ncbi:MAG: DNA replication/repair protein RecF [Acetobacter papayae]